MLAKKAPLRNEQMAGRESKILKLGQIPVFFSAPAHCTQWHTACLTSPEEFSRLGRVRHGELKKARSGAGAD